MRVEFVKAFEKHRADESTAVFVTGDLGYNALEGLMQKMAKRFLNAGVAEQNMIGLSAGIALAGYEPWVYSIVPFVTLRCLEQIRNDLCFHKLPVRLVGNGGGYTYGIMGATHHALEDLGILKTLPGMELFFPAGGDQVDLAVQKIAALAGPSYLRLAISGHAADTSKFLSEDATTLTRHYFKGDRATVVGVGHAVQPVLTAVANGAIQDVDVFSVARFPFRPGEDKALRESVERTGKVWVVEEHRRAGGMGESLREVFPRAGSFEVIAVGDSATEPGYGSAKYHQEKSGLSPQSIAQAISQGARK